MISLPLEVFKRAITQHGFSTERFVESLNINLLAKNFSWSDVALISTPAKIFSKYVMAVNDSGSSGVVVSHGCVAHLGIQPDDQVEMNIASLGGLKKKVTEVLYEIAIEVGKLLVTLPALVAEGLFVGIILDANWLKAVGACLNITRLEIKVMNEKA